MKTSDSPRIRTSDSPRDEVAPLHPHAPPPPQIIRAYDSLLDSSTGPPLSAVALGSLVVVTLELTSADALSGVLLEDWLPAGLEALDPNLAGQGGPRSASSGGALGGDWGGGCWWWWRCPSFERETYKDRVEFYAPRLYAGSHTLEYVALAATRGKFVLPPAKASATLQPELMGLSAGGVLAVGGAVSTPSVANKDRICPQDCSGRGSCQRHSGVCLCDKGTTGAACDGEPLPPPQFPMPKTKELNLTSGSTHRIPLPIPARPDGGKIYTQVFLSRIDEIEPSSISYDGEHLVVDAPELQTTFCATLLVAASYGARPPPRRTPPSAASAQHSRRSWHIPCARRQAAVRQAPI